MRRHWRLARLFVGMVPLGCGEIVEVPVASSTGTTDEPTSASEGTSTTAASGETSPPDIDDASTSSAADDGSSGGTTGGVLELIPFCLELEGGVSIPEDGSWAAAMLELPPQEGVQALGVGVRIAHPRVADLRVTVRAPDGTERPLLDNPACDAANVEALFLDEAAQLGNDQCLVDDVAAIEGTVAPLDALDELLRTPVGGVWTLALTDTVAGEVGDLGQVCVLLGVEDR